ncbi:MAG: OmpH family outer membrane protein [Crocinitomicaceae bacterium]|jgi:outer membrane protein|nr:OmpH family outer membrane protein [Crocinitomicaceae bacterium]MDG2465263.1 OmpH family outer membrane protein [Crocinitomicaceae bacterium]
MKNLLILALFIFGTSFAFSQKYGYIDSDYILNKMPDYSEAKTKLDKLAERWTKEIEERMELVTRKKADYAREEVLLPDEEKTNRLTELTRLETETLEMQKLRFGVKGDYFSKRQELIKPIQDKVYDAMQKVASKRNYSFVFDKANQSNLVYADSKYDLSDEVLKELDIK